MIQVLFTKNDHEWSDEQLQRMIEPIPEEMRKKILAYKGWQHRQSRILGKWLLIKLIKHFNLDLSLEDLAYTSFNKPYFKSAVLKPPLGGLGVKSLFDFSIAHSADVVICAGATEGSIGIDIESISPQNLDDYQDQLSEAEKKYIRHSADQLLAFYQIWTKKEALMKAVGRGIDMDLGSLDVLGENIRYESQQYSFHPVKTNEGYITHLTTTDPVDSSSFSVQSVRVPL